MLAAPLSALAEDAANPFPRLAEKLAANHPATIVCLGDSVTGVYYHTGGRRAYPEMLAVALGQAYPQARLNVVNAGISGDTTTGALNRLQKDVLDHKPELVTVMFGLNDMVRVPIDDYQANLQSIIQQCRGVGADVLLCTPNAVIDSGGRPTTKLVKYCDAIKQVAKKWDVPVCDCYAAHAALRESDPLAWRLLMSDAIHPNMDGHKVNAQALCQTITGDQVSLQDVAPPQPAITKTLARLQAGEPVKVLAMAPFDTLLSKAIASVHPQAKVEVTAWATEGKSLSEIEEFSKTVRAGKFDLVLVAVPLEATPVQVPPPEATIASYTWILNWSLSFGHQEWDVVGITPSLLHAQLSDTEKNAENFARQLIAAQDLTAIVRSDGETSSAAEILAGWFRKQAHAE
ncbi:MAG: SGNH/GDSL hydrolase family protein [Pirellulales bacterium]